jgi:hypothetical protein
MPQRAAAIESKMGEGVRRPACAALQRIKDAGGGRRPAEKGTVCLLRGTPGAICFDSKFPM